LAASQEALRLDEVRLLALTGAGGTEKTRIAVQAAGGLSDRFEQGLFFVGLAALREPGHLLV
jgi:predicted ATPase